MTEIGPQLPHDFLGQQYMVELPPLANRRSPGRPGFIAAGSTEITNMTPEPTRDNLPKIAYCFDGSFLPIRNGCSYTLYNLMEAVAESGQATPYFVVCDRGTDETEAYHEQKFSTIFMHPEDYYGENGVLEATLHHQEMTVAQFYSSEGTLNLAPRLRRAGLQTIFEVQNTDYLLLEQLGAEEIAVTEARNKQIAAQKLADIIFTRSTVDSNQAILLGADDLQVHQYEGAINPDDITFVPEREQNKSLVFMGHMNYAPNQTAVRHIIDRILPQLDDSYQMTIIGAGPVRLRSEYEAAGIRAYPADNVSRELQRHQVALAPLTEGSGTRLKLLDYLASGIPTLTTNVGVEGLRAEIRDAAIVEDDIDVHARIIKDIIARPEAYRDRIHKGRRYVEQHYSWKDAVTAFTSVYAMLQRKKGNI